MSEGSERRLLPPVAALQESVDRLADTPVASSLVDAAALLRAADAVRALGLLWVAEARSAGELDVAGAPSASAYVAEALGVTRGAAAAMVRVADALRGPLAPLAPGLLAGEYGVDHVAAVHRGLRGLPADGAEPVVLAARELCRLTTPTRVYRELRARVTALRPVVDDRDEAELDERLGLTLDVLPDGSGLWHGRTNPEDTAFAVALLEGAIRAQLAREESVQQAQADVLPLVEDPLTGTLMAPDPPLLPKPARRRRRLEALLTMLRHAARCHEVATGPAAALVVVVDAADLARAEQQPATTCTSLPTGARLRGRALLRLACDSDVAVAVRSLDATGREALDLGRSVRTATPAQKRALAARWGGCAVAGCTEPMSRTEAHHVRPWSLGGRTDLDDVVPICGADHHELHDRGQPLPLADGRSITPTGWGPPADELAPPAWSRQYRASRYGRAA